MITDIHVLIMAGGEGKRLAPLSTPDCPKQFLNFVGEDSLLKQTYDRALLLTNGVQENIHIATNKKYVKLVREHLPKRSKVNIIGEPLCKNTAPTIAYTAYSLYSKCPGAVMVVLPSDHYIIDNETFVKNMEHAVGCALKYDLLTTFGVVPTRPETNYGYVEVIPQPITKHFYRVKQFKEKPNLQLATKYCSDLDFYWNSGIFVWSLKKLVSSLISHMPDLVKCMLDMSFHERNESDIHKFFKKAENISIDYGLMERSDDVGMVPAKFDWSDLGNWEVIKKAHEDNAIDFNEGIKDFLKYGVC